MISPRLIRVPAPVLGLAFVTSVLIAGCASAPVPTEQMALAEASVQRASTPGTRMSAAAELQLATGKLTSARRAIEDKQYDRARQLAEQADVDAQVAESHAMSARARVAAQESQDAARALREEIARKSPR